jgi:HAE1 family hydrophobic/amphiphilic exporter-1
MMRSPAAFALQRPVTVLMLFASAVMIGLLAARLLPLEYFPELDAPFVMVEIPYPGSTPEEVEQQIVRPVEEVLATLSGIQRMRATASADKASFFLEMDWGNDVAVKAIEARERIEAIRDQLPADLRHINVFKFNTADQPVLTLRISSERDLSNAYDMIQRMLIRPLQRLPGVARVELQGLEPKEIRIELDADRVLSHGIDLNQLQQRLQAVNIAASAGHVDDGVQRYRVVPEAEFDSVDDYRNLVINASGLLLSDIAEVTYGSARRDYARHLDQRYAIGVSVFKENGANLVDVGARVLAEVDAIGNSEEMQGIRLFFLENQAAGVVDSLRELRNAGLFGAMLALLVLYFFLRNLPMTLIVALAVPVSIVITLGVMYFIGVSLNILSMMGLMLAIGMLVDNAVVVSESIATERIGNPQDVQGATLRGVRSVALAVAAGTVTSAAVFLPNIFGEQNQISIFLSHVAIAIVVSLAVSLVMAQTVIPLLASRLPPKPPKPAPMLDQLRQRYVGLLTWTLRHRWLTGIAIVVTLASIVVPASLVETDMFPTTQTRSLFLSYNLDGQYPLERIKPAVDRIESYLYGNQEKFEIRAVYSYYDEQGEAQSSILLTEEREAHRSSSDIAQEILAGLPAIAIGQPSFEQNRSGGAEGVSVTLTGESSERLQSLAADVMRQLAAIEGLQSVRVPDNPRERELQVRVDRDRASRLGFDSATLAQTVAAALRGTPLRDFKGPLGEVPVKMQFREEDRRDPDMLSQLQLRNASGQMVPLTAMVSVTEKPGSASIERLNRETALTIQANLNDITMQDAREQITAQLNSLNLPSGYAWRLGQGFQQEDETGQKMVLNILLALCIIYIVLAALFESMLYPATMIISILFSIIGVFWFFMLTGTTFSFMAMIGILILIGVVVNNGIVLIDHINQLRKAGMLREQAVLQAGHDRLRPILMTVGTTVLGLLPLCVGSTQVGGDGPPYFPMARAIVGGLVFSTLVSLVFLPSIYIMMDWLRQLPARIWHKLARIKRSSRLGRWTLSRRQRRLATPNQT